MITEVVVPDNNLQARLWTKQGTGGKLFYSYFDPHTYSVGWEKSTTQFGLPNWTSSDAGGGTVRTVLDPAPNRARVLCEKAAAHAVHLPATKAARTAEEIDLEPFRSTNNAGYRGVCWVSRC